MKKIRIFLASSNELKEERQLFEIEIYRKCKQWIDNGRFLHLDIWEDLSAKMSQTHSQDEYNKRVEEADMVVVLAYTKVGKYTLSEYKTAKRTFSATQKPFIYAYFKSNPPSTRQNRKDLESLYNFQDALDESGYFFSSFDDFNGFWVQFNKELDRLEENDFKQMPSDTPKRSNLTAESFEAKGDISLKAEQKNSDATFDKLKSENGEINIDLNQE